MDARIFDLVKEFFEKLSRAKEAEEILKRFNQKIQFNVKDGESFFVEIKNGSISVIKGETEPDIREVTNIHSDKETLTKLFQGKIGFVESMAGQRLYAREMLKKATVAWVGRLIKIGQEEMLRN